MKSICLTKEELKIGLKIFNHGTLRHYRVGETYNVKDPKTGCTANTHIRITHVSNNGYEIKFKNWDPGYKQVSINETEI